MTTAWIDIRGCKSDEIPDIISAAAEHRIEGVVFDGGSDSTLATRQAGVQWVAFKNGGNAAGRGNADADICVHCYNGDAPPDWPRRICGTARRTASSSTSRTWRAWRRPARRSAPAC